MHFLGILTEMSIFLHLNLVQLELRSASELVPLVEIIWVGLYLN